MSFTPNTTFKRSILKQENGFKDKWTKNYSRYIPLPLLLIPSSGYFSEKFPWRWNSSFLFAGKIVRSH